MRRKSRTAKNGGFTLIELIVVMAVMALLTAVSAGAYFSYQTYGEYRRNNEYARTVFLAAQASLAHVRMAGTLEELEEKMQQLLERNADGAGAEGQGLQESGCKEMYYLMAEQTQAGSETGKDSAGALLWEILEDYLPEDYLGGSALCVELNLREGIVQGVFCCDRAERLVYGESDDTALGLGRMGSRRNDGDYRKKYALGYYGAVR